MEVKWSASALIQLTDILDYITETGFDSYSKILESNISTKTKDLVSNYLIYPLDKYKRNNKGNFHAFEIDEYRISYKITKNTVTIIRIRHTSRRTRKY